MRLEERLSANVCLAKECALELFDDQSLDLEIATLTRQTTLQNAISDDDDFITILLGALWDTEEESSDQDDKDRTERYTLSHISVISNSRNVQVLGFLNNVNNYDSQLESFGIIHDHRSASLLCSLNARSTYLEEYKRQRSLTVSSTNSSFDKNRIKRRSSKVRLTVVPVSHAL